MERRKRVKKRNGKKRINAILYPIYKACSWDLLSFYSIEFLFYTITKGINASEILILTSLYIFFKIILQIPVVAISDYIGKRKSMIIGNLSVIVYIILLIVSPNFMVLVIAKLFAAFGFDLKTISEGNLLYDSVSTKGGEGIYTQLDSKGSSIYYILDTVFSLIAGFLFVINSYIPIFICLIFLVISVVLSFQFKEIYEPNKENLSFSGFLKGYKNDICNSFKFIKKSNRMKSYTIFGMAFYGMIKIMSTYQSNLLVSLDVSEEQFSMIYAVLSLIAAISVKYSKVIQRKFKNKTLTFLSMSYIIAIIVSGIASIIFLRNFAIPFVLIQHIIMITCESQWWVTEYTYLKNFTTPKTRSKISFTYELTISIGAVLMSLIGAALLKVFTIEYATVIVGIGLLACMVVILDYMRTRVGLKPSQYTKADLEFEESVK